MSIFKDVKEDAVQNEETKDDLFTVVSEEEQDDVDLELLDSLMEDDSLVAPEEDEATEEEPAEEPVAEAPAETAAAPAERHADIEGVTVITKGTTINGSIISDCSLDVMGTINGDIECLGKLTISGKVTGNAMAAEVFVNTDRLEGNITSEGCVKIGLGTVIIGDIVASSGVIAGAVKGEIDIKGPVVIDSTAIIKGNVKAKSVQMNNGAVLEGFCSLAYASVEIDNIFE
ncbi:MAG: polymer-forming cytoskeletal protein [Lachnospiraceae bacterium]|nr:polymer-forming cytoskeletal protein [Lachnospiraceae bacterium]MBQ8549493.1 polymer-forming cytoskeletal protein [Lachnospiraceae bacterium]